MNRTNRFHEDRRHDPEVEYELAGTSQAKTARGEFDRITATVTGKASGAFTKLAKKFREIDDLNKELTELRNKTNDEVKQQIEGFFEAGDAIYTRVIETRSLTIRMAKDVQAATKEERKFDFEGFLSDMRTLLESVDQSLIPAMEQLVKAHTQVIEKTTPHKKGAVAVNLKDSLREDSGADLEVLSDLVSRLVGLQLDVFDRKIAGLESRY